MMPTQRYTLRDDDVVHLDELITNDEERMAEQQRVTHDYSLDDLRKARLRRARIRRAFRLKEDI